MASIEPSFGKYVPLRTVCSYFLDQYKKSDGDLDEVWLMGLRALVELNFDISAEPKTVRLPVLENLTVPFPADYISWTKIGLLNEQGEVSTLRINNGLTTFRDNNPNRLEDLTPNVNDSLGQLITAPYFFNYYNNNNYFNLFGVGGGLNQFGSCTVDETNNVVVLSPEFKYDSILFEYISSPEKDIDYKVLLSLQEAVIAFIAWKMKLDSPQNYYSEVVKARRRLPGKKVTLQQIAQVIRENSGFFVKA